MRTHTIFVYGTLQFPEIMAAVAGAHFTGTAATLDGYRRYAVADAPFPGIAPDPRGRVDGLVYAGLDGAALERVDDFEGEPYRRETVAVRAEDGRTVAADTYVIRPDWRSILLDRAWDAEAFARQWHDHYLRAFGVARNEAER